VVTHWLLEKVGTVSSTQQAHGGNTGNMAGGGMGHGMQHMSPQPAAMMGIQQGGPAFYPQQAGQLGGMSQMTTSVVPGMGHVGGGVMSHPLPGAVGDAGVPSMPASTLQPPGAMGLPGNVLMQELSEGQGVERHEASGCGHMGPGLWQKVDECELLQGWLEWEGAPTWLLPLVCQA
jgi:putative alpha-1,2-mannosidase